MKQTSDPYKMTLRQFFLFLVIGILGALFLIFKVYALLRVGGEGVYAVQTYAGLSLSLSRTEGLFLPEKSALPRYDDADFWVCTGSTSKLTSVKDGYEIHLRGEDAYSIQCAREDDPSFDDSLPLTPDRSIHGTDIEVESTEAHVRVRFLHDGWFYRLYARRGSDDTIDRTAALDTLLNMTDHILQQAG